MGEKQNDEKGCDGLQLEMRAEVSWSGPKKPGKLIIQDLPLRHSSRSGRNTYAQAKRVSSPD